MTAYHYLNLSQYNKQVTADPQTYLQNTDQAYFDQLFAIAKDIDAHKDTRPIILLSGPSGSGKTTSAYLLEQILEDLGCVTHTLSMDNYFLPLSEEEQELVMQGKVDLESPNRLNHDLLNEQLNDMIACKTVLLPRYDFVHGLSVASGLTLTRKPGELIIMEGIHALNPSVITLPDDETTRIYISVRTRVQSETLTLHPSKVRLLRRMIRDQIFRNRPLKKTVQLYGSVELGELRYIMPYKYRSTYDIDTFIDYELSVLRFMLPKLKQLDDETKEQIRDLLEILEQTVPIDEKLVHSESLVREFIGGGKFTY